jgi:hypothetical protein
MQGLFGLEILAIFFTKIKTFQQMFLETLGKNFAIN